jgi:anti-sigma factor RsiW
MNCLDEGILQSYFDEELSPERREAVEAHIAACATCAAAARQAESEIQMLALALEPETTVMVPTERLRERINAAIADRNLAPAAATNRRARWKERLAALVAPLAGPRAAIGFAGLATVVIMTALFGLNQWRDHQSSVINVAKNSSVNNSASQSDLASSSPTPVVAVRSSSATPAPNPATTSPNDHSIQQAAMSVKAARPGSALRLPTVKSEALAKDSYLPGEQSYLKAIATLEKAIPDNPTALPPSMLIEYKRNLEVVDQAITATRSAAQRNPKDPDAVEFLLTAYQSKVDLLSAVANQTQMAAPEN